MDEDHHIDVFPGALIGGRYRRPTFVQTELSREDLFPLRQEQLRGRDILVPRDYEKKLAAVYGPDWHTPDPFWEKIRPPALQEYFRQIQLSEGDLLEIADLSPTEREPILSLIAQDKNKPSS